MSMAFASPKNFFLQPLLPTTAMGPRYVEVPYCFTLDFQKWDIRAQKCVWIRAYSDVGENQPYTPYPNSFPQEEPFLPSSLPTGLSLFLVLNGHMVWNKHFVPCLAILPFQQERFLCCFFFPFYIGKKTWAYRKKIKVRKPNLSRIILPYQSCDPRKSFYFSVCHFPQPPDFESWKLYITLSY